MSAISIPTSSESRIPHPYSISKIIRSRSGHAAASSFLSAPASIASSSPFTSSMLGTRGRFAALRRAHQQCRVLYDFVLLRHPPEPRPHRSQSARRARLGQPAPIERSQVRADVQVLHRANLRPRAQRLIQIIGKVHHLAPVRPHRMRRCVALILQHAKKLLRQPRELAPLRPISASAVALPLLPTNHYPLTLSFSSPSDGAPEHLLQMLHRHMRIHLRGGNIRVAQQPLHAPQVGPMLHHVRRATMAQHVRAGPVNAPSTLTDAALTISHTHCRVSACPRTLRNNARCIPARASDGRPRWMYSSSASTALRPSGTIRSLSPLPRTCARAWSRCRSSSPSATISPTLSPPAYSNSRIAESRSASAAASRPPPRSPECAPPPQPLQHLRHLALRQRLRQHLPARRRSMFTVGSARSVCPAAASDRTPAGSSASAPPSAHPHGSPAAAP